jgi:c(7)-type cytochrome triheme protein
MGGTFELPPLPPADQYGTVLIDRTSTRNGVKPVVFSHLQHRMKFTCRVCHSELEFNMKTGSTEITELANRRGKYCGACHNGRTAFKQNGNCDRCHSGDIASVSGKYASLFKLPLPRTSFGDGIDWAEALQRKVISPARYLATKPQDIPFNKDLVLESEMSIIPPAVFSHKTHLEWLDCSNCHPEIFNIKKKTTKHFSMAYVLQGQFCGVCHLAVAFPMNDCRRCHPGMKE